MEKIRNHPAKKNDGDDDGLSSALCRDKHLSLDIDLVSPPGESVRLDSVSFAVPGYELRRLKGVQGKLFLHHSGYYYMDGVHRYGRFRTFSYFRTLFASV